MRRYVAMVAMTAAAGLLAGCGLLGRGQECAPIGVREGISLDIEPSAASGITSAALELCWDGQCRNETVELMESRDTIALPCEGDGADAACGATVGPPTGGFHGFADITDLPAKPIEVSVTLRGPTGEVGVGDRITVTPKEPKAQPNTCGSSGALQTGIILGDVGLRERR